MKHLIKKFLSFIFSARHERLVLIALPCLAIAVACAVIIPLVFSFSREAANTAVSQQLEAATPVPAIPTEKPAVKAVDASASPSPSVSAVQATQVYLTGISTEKDLYIHVRDMSGKAVPSSDFRITVSFPDGRSGTYNTDPDGGCYLVSLSSGVYRVSMEKLDGYTQPDPIDCTVKETVAYTPIEQVDDYLDVMDVSDVIDEVKTNESEAPQETVAEVIAESQPTGQYIYDSNGNLTYSYTCSTDENGYILDTNGNPTDVLPDYYEGRLIGGLKKVNEYEYRSVTLFNDDNTPIAGYAIKATPARSEDIGNGGWLTENGNVYYEYNGGERATGLKSIDGHLYFFDSNGIKASSVGIDVSFYNGNINWSAVKNAGVDFVIIRVGGRGWGTGALYDDSCFYNYLRGAKAAGLKVGVYFYSTAVNRVEAVQEASVAVDRLAGTSLDFPIFIDTEYSGDYPNGRSDSLSVAERLEVVQAFCETVKNSGYTPGVYASEYFLFHNLEYGAVSKYCIWMASYTENNKRPTAASRYDIWQYTDRAKISGISGNCDLNIIF